MSSKVIADLLNEWVSDSMISRNRSIDILSILRAELSARKFFRTRNIRLGRDTNEQ